MDGINLRIGSAVLVAGWLALAGGRAGAADGRVFEAGLSGAKVQPAPVTTALRGRARFAFAADASSLAYRVRLRNAAQVTGVQLRCAGSDGTGPVIAELLGPVAGGWNGKVRVAATLTAAQLTGGADCTATIGRAIVDPAALAAAMADRLVYVGVDSAAFPDGEARGQARAFVPAVSATNPATDSGTSQGGSQTGGTPSGSTPSGGTQLTATSTPVVSVGLATGGLTVGIVPVSPFLPPSFGTAAVSMPAAVFGVPIILSNPFSATPTFATATLSVPGAGFVMPFTDGFALPGATLTLPVSFDAAQPAGISQGPASVTIPTFSANLPLALQTANGPVSATAILTLPGTTLPLAGTPAGLPLATLDISLPARF